MLMGNAIDNAVEATEKVTRDVQKLVSFKLVTNKSRVMITIDNPVEEDIDVTKLRSTKSDKRNHGIGVANSSYSEWNFAITVMENDEKTKHNGWEKIF